MTLSIRVVQSAVADEFVMTREQINGPRRSQAFAIPRHIAMYLASEVTSATYEELGRAFGERDHTTITHGARRGRERLEESPELRGRTKRILDRLERLAEAERAPRRRQREAIARLEAFRAAARGTLQ